MPDISNFPENKAWHFSWNLIKVCSDESGTPVQCKDAVLHNGISYTGETTSSYWIRTQLVINDRSIRYWFDAEQAVKHSVNSRRGTIQNICEYHHMKPIGKADILKIMTNTMAYIVSFIAQSVIPTWHPVWKMLLNYFGTLFHPTYRHYNTGAISIIVFDNSVEQIIFNF